MSVKQSTIRSHQGYSIVQIREMNGAGDLVIETFALMHESGGYIGEYATLDGAVNELNRMLFPLPGLSMETVAERI
ncbi:hypothetical protein QQM79_08370 [Marinobacteraceae bacterium S3BR75-40.1]